MNWEEIIRRSKIFMVVADEAYFEDAICFCQTELARDLKMPFRILLQKGVELPEGFLDGVTDHKIEAWQFKEDLAAAVRKLLQNQCVVNQKERT